MVVVLELSWCAVAMLRWTVDPSATILVWLWNAELTAAETAGCRVEIISYTLVSGQPPKAAGMHSRT